MWEEPSCRDLPAFNPIPLLLDRGEDEGEESIKIMIKNP
jgi:hypothetical protein